MKDIKEKKNENKEEAMISYTQRKIMNLEDIKLEYEVALTKEIELSKDIAKKVGFLKEELRYCREETNEISERLHRARKNLELCI